MDTDFESSIPFNTNRVHAAAVYCSDGRFGEQVNELLHDGLNLPRYDRLVVPGGGACLASHFSTYREEEAALNQLKFLINAHQLQKVVLIAHEDCAFYSEILRVSPLQMETKQHEDLAKAVERVRRLRHGLVVKGYFARKQPNGHIRFETVPV